MAIIVKKKFKQQLLQRQIKYSKSKNYHHDKQNSWLEKLISGKIDPKTFKRNLDVLFPDQTKPQATSKDYAYM